MSLRSVLTPEFLKTQYIENQKSLYQIADEIGCSHMTVKRHMERNNISRRSKGEAIHLRRKNNFGLTNEIKNYIDGLILGDGSVIQQVKWTSCYRQGFAFRYNGWALKIKKDFKKFGIDSKTRKLMVKERIIRGKTTSASKAVHLYTRMYEEFNIFRKRWYPNGVKKIPDDLEISSELLANWYMGDGSINQSQKNIVLSSLSFDRSDLLMVSKNVNKKLNINSVVHKTGIYINRKHAQIFLDYIEPFKVSCFDYKWGY